MISMAAVNYDTCPMEGFDSQSKKILNLPAAAEINMIIGCEFVTIWRLWERFRIPLKKFILNYKTTLLF
jgi:hypothetical protein